MRRALVIAIAAVLVVGGAVWAGAAIRSHASADRAVAPQPGLLRATHFYGVGPSAEYSFDSGSIGTAQKVPLTFPSGATYDVVVTISLDYETSADDRFVVSSLARRDTEYGHVMSADPENRAIPASTVRTSTTAAFLYRDLPGGRAFWFAPAVNVSHRGGNRARIESTRVLMTVEATPSG